MDPNNRVDQGVDGATEPVVKSATEARQGAIVLGKWGHLIWIGSVVVIVLLALVFWSL